MSASGYQPEANETIIITASSPVVFKEGANSVVAAGEIWRMTCLLLGSFMASYSLELKTCFFMCCRKCLFILTFKTTCSRARNLPSTVIFPLNFVLELQFKYSHTYSFNLVYSLYTKPKK